MKSNPSCTNTETALPRSPEANAFHAPLEVIAR